MLVKGINDSPAHIAALKAAVARVRPDRIELNTVVRPPADRRAGPLGPADLRRVRAVLGPRAEAVASFARRKQAPAAGALERAVLATVGRRPQTAEDIAVALGRHRGDVLKALSVLAGRGRARRVVHGEKTYFARARG
jgi:wyosine [tRNA(Phe)-imidazoG37] synthetase (radical SAM superfamily)